ncbi:hypothetical protein C8Q80DRAFT_905546 [Daedaleopsis nitida]|nr:hypothetical protein C8Q80DRAFT_905546 [Daedaleopsis nitida]
MAAAHSIRAHRFCTFSSVGHRSAQTSSRTDIVREEWSNSNPIKRKAALLTPSNLTVAILAAETRANPVCIVKLSGLRS